ncbi:hypothetical protein Fmac_026457 [Flemingia macrophylla]|uniref:Uncharacterized protein n=1 Tax=Flemingia macrophylla TaxID=520843 RepID=A0ABD1LEX2_9FABA
MRNMGWLTNDHSKSEAEERNSENNDDHATSKYYFEKTKGARGLAGEVGRLSELALVKKEPENASVKIAELRAHRLYAGLSLLRMLKQH